MIYFVTVNLEQSVHAQALGFTKMLYMHGWGSSPQEAVDNVKSYLAAKQLTVRKDDGATLAKQQDVRRYSFPEQICGLPEDLALDAIRNMALPEDWHAKATAAYLSRRDAVATGRSEEHTSELQ